MPFRTATLIAFLAGSATAQETLLSTDLNGDGNAERFVIIVDAEGIASLLITDERGITTRFDEIVWSGKVYGTMPWLELTDSGALLLVAGNEGYGRTRWHQALTIAHRDSDYRVVGFAYDWYDTQDLDLGGTCDIDLTTGSGRFTQLGHPDAQFTEVEIGARPLRDWDTSIFPPDCNLLPSGD